MGMVTTTLGNIDESELTVKMLEQDGGPNEWVVAREAVYIGSAFPEAVNTIVRRDVWVTLKQGLAAQAVSEL